MVQDPVLGLKYPVAKAQFEPVPQEVFDACPDLVNERSARHSWVYASLQDGGHRYFVIGGFYVRRKPMPGEPRYEVDPNGALVDLSEDGCALEGPVRDVFDWRVGVLPPTALDRLAADLSQRYARNFGGLEKVRLLMRQQRVTIPRNSLALRKAFAVE